MVTTGAGARSDPTMGRSFYRVSTSLALTAEPIEPDDLPAAKASITARVDAPRPEADPLLVAWLDRIERKLDQLLAHEGVSECPPLTDADRKVIELSGSGLSFRSGAKLSVGQRMLVRFELPELPVRLVSCVARIALIQPDDDGEDPTVGLAFETIRPLDRDAVVAYTVGVQRQQIRAERHGPERGRE